MRLIGQSLGESLEVRAKACEVSESPIEAAMLTALLSGHQHTDVELTLSGRGIVLGTYRTFFVDTRGITALVIPQLRVGRYRLDIGLVVERDGRRVYAAIECDGREFHSHPDDVGRDKNRDRDLAAAGWLVCRFPGSDISAMKPGGELIWSYLVSLASVWCKSGQDLMADVPGGA
jgi:hypothetical protein